MPKILRPIFFFSILGKVSKLALVKFFSELHMLVDFKYLFCINLLTLEIWQSVNNIKMMC